jgi:hypothetical protein
VAERKQQRLHLLFIGKACVIGTEGDFHGQAERILEAKRRVNAGKAIFGRINRMTTAKGGDTLETLDNSAPVFFLIMSIMFIPSKTLPFP